MSTKNAKEISIRRQTCQKFFDLPLTKGLPLLFPGMSLKNKLAELFLDRLITSHNEMAAKNIMVWLLPARSTHHVLMDIRRLVSWD